MTHKVNIYMYIYIYMSNKYRGWSICLRIILIVFLCLFCIDNFVFPDDVFKNLILIFITFGDPSDEQRLKGMETAKIKFVSGSTKA